MSTSRAGRTGTILSLPERVIPQAPPPLRKGFHAGRRRAALASLGHRPSDPTGFDGDVSVRYEAVYRRAEPACGITRSGRLRIVPVRPALEVDMPWDTHPRENPRQSSKVLISEQKAGDI